MYIYTHNHTCICIYVYIYTKLVVIGVTDCLPAACLLRAAKLLVVQIPDFFFDRLTVSGDSS